MRRRRNPGFHQDLTEQSERNVKNSLFKKLSVKVLTCRVEKLNPAALSFSAVHIRTSILELVSDQFQNNVIHVKFVFFLLPLFVPVIFIVNCVPLAFPCISVLFNVAPHTLDIL